ncbi:MAG: hypothetical protein Fur002_07080 [Anaerolineales bacterium]
MLIQILALRGVMLSTFAALSVNSAKHLYNVSETLRYPFTSFRASAQGDAPKMRKVS